jgi:flagellar biogenesis protein FliO
MVALMTQLALVTVMVVGFLLLVYYLLKQNPRLLQGFSLSALLPTPSSGDAGLVIESRLPLDAKKSLMIIRAGSERYLIGATIDRIDAITRMGDGQLKTTAIASPLPDNLALADSPYVHDPVTSGINERPVGLSGFANAFATAPVSQKTATPMAATSLTAQSPPLPISQTSFQQQLQQVAIQQGIRPGSSMLPEQTTSFKKPMAGGQTIPQPRRQARGLNKVT